jgi:heptosyltransferase II
MKDMRWPGKCRATALVGSDDNTTKMHKTRFRTESRSCSPWLLPEHPRRVLIIRMHAIGDVALTLPAVMSFGKQFPGTRVDFLTTDDCAPMLDAVSISGEVFSFPGRLNRWERLIQGVEYGWRLRAARYDAVIDLQRNWVSRLIRRMTNARAWSEFDRFSKNAASHRVHDCFQSAGFSGTSKGAPLLLNDTAVARAKQMLLSAGWTGTSRLTVLNPAGLWMSRQWPIENYVQVARRCLNTEDVQYLLVGTERIRGQSHYLAEHLGHHIVNLVGRTTLGEALAILQFCSNALTEDSGLMHMAWASGIPLVALFGSTDHEWSAPPGDFVRCFHSGDLPCGACMQPQCKYGDVHCLTRITPQIVCDALQELQAAKRSIRT